MASCTSFLLRVGTPLPALYRFKSIFGLSLFGVGKAVQVVTVLRSSLPQVR